MGAFERDEQIDFMRENSPSLIVEQPQLEEEEEKQQSQEMEIVMESSRSGSDHQEVLVYGTWLSFSDDRFHRNDFYQKTQGLEVLTCSVCRGSIAANQMRLTCIFCSGDSHWECATVICSCTCTPVLTSPTIPLLLRPISYPSFNFQILMP